MGLWSDLAEYVGPTPNHGGRMVEQRGIVLHIMAGTYDGSIAWGKNPTSGVSFHFGIRRRDGHIGQLLDTDVTAWTQRQGNGHWVSAENEGYLPDPLTPAQIEANAQLFARGHKVYGWPLQIANSPTERGLGHHSMGAENGYDWGHSSCPGEAIKAQKPAILARAIEIVNGQGKPMAKLLKITEPVGTIPANALYGSGGGGFFHVNDWDDAVAYGQEWGADPNHPVVLSLAEAYRRFGPFLGEYNQIVPGPKGDPGPPGPAVLVPHEHPTPAGTTGPAVPA